MTSPGDWIEWKGGECPVDPDTRVAVKLRSEGSRGPNVAEAYQWKHFADGAYLYSEGFDIIAYRVVSS